MSQDQTNSGLLQNKKQQNGDTVLVQALQKPTRLGKAKEKPILMSGPMVRAILSGTKTQTRRTEGFDEINKNPDDYQFLRVGEFQGELHAFFHQVSTGAQVLVKCKKGRPGDRLWVKETYYQLGHWISVPGVKTKGGRQKWKFVPQSDDIEFEPPPEYRKGRHHEDPLTVAWHKRLGRFMPRRYSRLLPPVITNLRVERLQDISEEDAKAEGIEPHPFHDGSPAWKDYSNTGSPFENPVRSYETLWRHINGPGSWEKNPWVWVIEFKRL